MKVSIPLFEPANPSRSHLKTATKRAVARRGAAWASVALALLAVSACGAGSQGASTTPTPERLFVVVESSSATAQPDTVAIVGLDGIARAKATFQPRTGPGIPDAYVPLQGVAQVIGSGVYYIDGAGTVRVLRVGSQPQVVARFPLQPAQEDVWFAVSPDGSSVLAGIVTFPALGPIIPGTSWNELIGSTKFDLESASSGGQTKTLVHLESPQGGNSPAAMFPIAWTSAGSVAMLPTYLASQNAWPGGPLYLIDETGTKTAQLGGADCWSASITSSGFIACQTGTSGAVTVRNATGENVWLTHVDGFNARSLHVSQDGQTISSNSQVETHAGGMVAMPTGFRAEGWLDNKTVVGTVTPDANTIGGPNEGNLLWISLDNPNLVHDLGFRGDFVAPLA
jgi:hypothetical protein